MDLKTIHPLEELFWCLDDSSFASEAIVYSLGSTSVVSPPTGVTGTDELVPQFVDATGSADVANTNGIPVLPTMMSNKDRPLVLSAALRRPYHRHSILPGQSGFVFNTGD